jgi:hypothetical protein
VVKLLVARRIADQRWVIGLRMKALVKNQTVDISVKVAPCKLGWKGSVTLTVKHDAVGQFPESLGCI